MNKKKTYYKKANYISSPPLYLALALFFAVLALFVVVSSFPSSLNKKNMVADFGGIDNVLNQNGQWDKETKIAYFKNKKINPPSFPLAFADESKVLSAQNGTGSNKWIDISLNEQKLRAYEGEKLIYEFPISSGLPWTPTVKGKFNIWYKIRYTRMIGGSIEQGNYYNLPNVPYNMFFNGDYALHGTYWHNNFGHPMSHGCVNLSIPAAETLFYWTEPTVPLELGYIRSSAGNPGTRVVVHD